MICEYLLSFMITSSGECIDLSHLVGGGVAHKERRSGFARSWVMPFVGDAVLTNWQRWEHPSIAGVCGGAGL